MDERDLALLKIAQDGISLTSRPYLALGEKLGMSEQEVVDRLSSLEQEGIIRRFAATIGHRALGIVANAMIAWRASPGELQKAGALLGSDEEVTHCYERASCVDWPYNLYTMVHSRSRDECLETARRLSRISGIAEYRVLFSEREYKKTSARI